MIILRSLNYLDFCENVWYYEQVMAINIGHRLITLTILVDFCLEVFNVEFEYN